MISNWPRRTVVADTVGETACIFLAGLYRAEQVIAERLLRLVSGKLPWPYIDPEKALPWIEQKTGLSLAESQITAIRLALLSKVLVITGGPDVGKTTIVNSILRILAAKGVSLSLCAPTGRAAKRMTEATGFVFVRHLMELFGGVSAELLGSPRAVNQLDRCPVDHNREAVAAQTGPII